ncbi:MAG TPA: prepilin-type N-terminal cleavage/methylation domain-containing protein [Acidimicrobiia bacterium]|jgi:prepilin-type N-terminal cleavage/methylation domain-containing protein
MTLAEQRIERERARGEAGVTLTELLIAMMIAAIIIVPIGAAIFYGLRTTGATQTRVTESASANLMASYFVPDVQGAEDAALNAPEPSAACGASATTASLVLVTSPTSSVSYVQGTGPRATTLYRRTCSGGSTTGLARVAASLAQPPQFACDTGTCASFHSIIATLVQGDSGGKNKYSTRLEALRRSVG